MSNVAKLSEDIPLLVAIQKILDRIESNKEPETILDSIIHVGVVNPLQQQIVRRHIQTHVRPGGSHEHLTNDKKWLVSGERWALEVGLSKGKSIAKYDAKISGIEQYRGEIYADENLPEPYRESAGVVLDILTKRAGKRLDEASITNIMEAQKAQAATISAMKETMERQHAEKLLKLSEERNRMLESLVNHMMHEKVGPSDMAAE